MGACHSNKKNSKPSQQMSGDLDDETRQKTKHLEQFSTYTIKGDEFFLQQYFQLAFEQYEKALEEISKVHNQYEDQTFLVSTVFQRLSFVCSKDKKYKEALDWQKQALEIREERLHANDSLVAGGFSSIGYAYQEAKLYKVSLEYNEKALDIRKELYGEEHWVTAISYERLGVLKALEKDYQEAKRLILKANSINKLQYGEGSVYVAYNQEKLADVYYLQKNYEEAVEWYKKAISILKSKEAQVVDMFGKDERNKLHGEVMETFKEHPLYIKSEIVKLTERLGECYLEMKKVDEAKESFKSAVPLAMEVSTGAGQRTQEEVIKLCFEHGKTDEKEIREIAVCY